jgi:phosphatidylinositol glycan class B
MTTERLGSSPGETGFVLRHVALIAFVTLVTAWFSYAFFHPDEHFQVIEFMRMKLGHLTGSELPWEHAAQIRPWLQPFGYWAIARVLESLSVHDIFTLCFFLRLVTAALNLGALAMFLRTSLPWLPTIEESRAYIRAITFVGWWPYLFVRTSSESASMAALVAAVALLLDGARPVTNERRWITPAMHKVVPPLFGGMLLGLAFEARFQTAIASMAFLGWLVAVGRPSWRGLVLLSAGGLVALALGAVADRWGYGVWGFPAWSYVRANLLQGVAATYGVDPVAAYVWLLPANIFSPAVLAVMACMLVAWVRAPWHPLTSLTFPFVAVHSLISHKEERFLFPIAVFAVALLPVALGPSFCATGRRAIVTERFANWAWPRRYGTLVKLIAASSLLSMTFLAFVPLGWNHHVRFSRFVHDRIGESFRATVLPDVDVGYPPFHGRVYDVDVATPVEVVERMKRGDSRAWLVANQPVLCTGTLLDQQAELVYSELPTYRNRALTERIMALVETYNARAPASLRRLRFRSLYRLTPGA